MKGKVYNVGELSLVYNDIELLQGFVNELANERVL